MKRRRNNAGPTRPPFDGTLAVSAALSSARAAMNAGKPKGRKVRYAIAFARIFGVALAENLSHIFPGTEAGEIPSTGIWGLKRLDLRYSSLEAGLGLGMSFKSVHFGERLKGNAGFIHNMKRNDEELRVEATGHHLRQPYSVLVAILFLPFEACEDAGKDGLSSFAEFVEYLWRLKGREEPEDPPDRFEFVFVALYARDGSSLILFEVGGPDKCPCSGRPRASAPRPSFRG